MAIKSAGSSLKMSEIDAEFDQGTAPWSLSAMGVDIGIASGNQVNISNFYGKSNLLDTQSLTVGRQWRTFKNNTVYSDYGYNREFLISSGTPGSCNDGTSNFLGNNNIQEIKWVDKDLSVNRVNHVMFTVVGTHAAASFDTMKIHNTTFNRSDATHTQANGDTSWRWDTNTNPFPSTVGTVISVVWK